MSRSATATLRALSIVKTASPTTYAGAGESIGYSYLVTNTGSVILAGPVTVADDRASVTCPAVTTIGNNDANLDAGEAITCTASYSITAADVTAGFVTNTASASAGGATSPPAQATVTAAPDPSIDLTKIATQASFSAAGQSLDYTITATNDGNVTLSDVTISDPLLASLSCSPLQPATLAPGETLVCTGSYSVTQADLDAGAVDNTAGVTGDPPTGAPVTGSAGTSVPAAQTVLLDLAKSADPTSVTTVGETVTYTLVATNGGNVTLSDVADQRSAAGRPGVPARPAGRACAGREPDVQRHLPRHARPTSTRAASTTPPPPRRSIRPTCPSRRPRRPA